LDRRHREVPYRSIGKACRNGDTGENGFTKATWQLIVTALNEAFSDILEKPITITQAKWKECAVSSNEIDLLLYS